MKILTIIISQKLSDSKGRKHRHLKANFDRARNTRKLLPEIQTTQRRLENRNQKIIYYQSFSLYHGDPPCPQKPYKVWNFDKTEGRIIAASKLEELQLKGNVRLMIVVNQVQNTRLFYCHILKILKQFNCFRPIESMLCNVFFLSISGVLCLIKIYQYNAPVLLLVYWRARIGLQHASVLLCPLLKLKGSRS